MFVFTRKAFEQNAFRCFLCQRFSVLDCSATIRTP